MTREEHLQWCKERALEYLKPGPHYSVPDAVASMLSDLRKHGETGASAVLGRLGMLYAMNHDSARARRFINGFR